jgi:hypothetical protein
VERRGCSGTNIPLCKWTNVCDSPSIVKRVEPRGSHVYCILEEPRGFREIPWKLFKKAMKDAGLQNITKNSNRKVTRPEIISAIYGLWAKH